MNGARVALVTGCGQGLGAEVCRQLRLSGYTVVATYRDLKQAYAQGSLLTSPGLTHEQMDVTSKQEVEEVVSRTLAIYDHIDVLINSAGVYLDRESSPPPELLPLAIFQHTLEVNLIGAVRVMEAVLPSMISRHKGCIVNVSSGMGRVVELDGDAIYYRTSKAALTTISRCISKRVALYGVTINSVCPGWVRTEMGGSDAVRSVQQGAEGIVSAALSPRKNGVLLRDNEDFGW